MQDQIIVASRAQLAEAADGRLTSAVLLAHDRRIGSSTSSSSSGSKSSSSSGCSRSIHSSRSDITAEAGVSATAIGNMPACTTFQSTTPNGWMAVPWREPIRGAGLVAWKAKHAQSAREREQKTAADREAVRQITLAQIWQIEAQIYPPGHAFYRARPEP